MAYIEQPVLSVGAVFIDSGIDISNVSYTLMIGNTETLADQSLDAGHVSVGGTYTMSKDIVLWAGYLYDISPTDKLTYLSIPDVNLHSLQDDCWRNLPLHGWQLYWCRYWFYNWRITKYWRKPDEGSRNKFQYNGSCERWRFFTWCSISTSFLTFTLEFRAKNLGII